MYVVIVYLRKQHQSPNYRIWDLFPGQGSISITFPDATLIWLHFHWMQQVTSFDPDGMAHSLLWLKWEQQKRTCMN